ERLAALLGAQEVLQRRGSDQAADMSGEDAISAALHIAPSDLAPMRGGETASVEAFSNSTTAGQRHVLKPIAPASCARAFDCQSHDMKATLRSPFVSTLMVEPSMMSPFETALKSRVDAMLDA